jgi:hypothetical protein
MGAPLRKSLFQQKLQWYEQQEAGQSTPGFPFSHDCAGSGTLWRVPAQPPSSFPTLFAPEG